MSDQPFVDAYIEQHIRQLRAPLKSRTIFGQAGRAIVRSAGQRRVIAPDGTSFEIIELPEGGNQIITDNSQHAHVRAQPIRIKFNQQRS